MRGSVCIDAPHWPSRHAAFLCSSNERQLALKHLRIAREQIPGGENFATETGFWGQMCPLGHFNAGSGGGSPTSSASCARYQSDLRAPKFCAAANPLVVRRTIVSKALSAAAASISGSDAWCRFLMISACRGNGTSPELRNVVITSSCPKFCNHALSSSGVRHTRSPSCARVLRNEWGLK